MGGFIDKQKQVLNTFTKEENIFMVSVTHDKNIKMLRGGPEMDSSDQKILHTHHFNYNLIEPLYLALQINRCIIKLFSFLTFHNLCLCNLGSKRYVRFCHRIAPPRADQVQGLAQGPDLKGLDLNL